MKLIVSLALSVNYMFCYIDCFGILNCKIVVIQLLVFAVMTVFNKPLMKLNENYLLRALDRPRDKNGRSTTYRLAIKYNSRFPIYFNGMTYKLI